MIHVLLAAVVFAWGFSWYAITLQVGEAPALVSVAYRFILAAGVMCLGLGVTGRFRLISWADQRWLVALGFCLFSMNFLSFYLAAHYLPSGILSVIFATAAIFGALNAWLFLRKPLEAGVLVAAVLGVVGLALLLWPELVRPDGRTVPWWAFALPFLGTYLFSLGNLISARLSQRHSVFNIVGQGMVWGAVWLVALCLLRGDSFVLPASPLYWAGVVYLALVASLLAFLTYLTLVSRVGVARASYATVLFPIVAMIVSTGAEGYQWSLPSVVGLLMALGGTYLTFAPALRGAR